jgi:hypothetical protein
MEIDTGVESGAVAGPEAAHEVLHWESDHGQE